MNVEMLLKPDAAIAVLKKLMDVF